MKKLSMILTVVLVIFGSSAIGHTSDECVVFEGIFEKSTRRPVAHFEYFQALDGEAIVKVYDEAGGHHAKKFRTATVSINGKKVIRSRDFFKKKFFRFWHYKKKKFDRCSYFKQQDDYIEKTVELTKGQNSLKVMLNSWRRGKIKVVIVKPKLLASDDSDCDFISDDGDENGTSYDNPCTGGSTALCDDNCPNDFNPDQADSDGDGIGDVCDNSDGYPKNIVSDPIDVGTRPYGPYGGIAVTPDGEFVYVSNFSEGTVSVIKTADNTVIDIPVEAGPLGVSVTPDGAFVYVNNYYDNSVSVIETFNNTVIDTIQVGDGPFCVSVTPDGEYAYVTNFNADTVSVIQTFNNTVIDIPVEAGPFGVSVTPNGAFAYVNNFASDTVSVIRTSDNKVIQSIPVGGGPSGVSVTPDGAYAYVNNYFDDSVSVIQTSNHTVIDTIQVGDQPYGGIAVSPDGKFVYVGNYGDGTVSVIGF